MVLTEPNRSVEKPKAKRSKYAARLAQNADEVRRAQRLRFEVFYLELNEGLVKSHFTGRDVDPFDNVCDHLIVEHLATDEIVGTYRLQTGAHAAANIGHYSEREFDFAPLRNLLQQDGGNRGIN
jgi:putative hemolysin